MSVQYKYYNNLKILLLFFINLIWSANNNPIFLIHGFMGWGRDELNSYYYWGGEQDLQELLKDKGFEVYTLSVGPISSNWERAIEAYTQIKGGCVDYGYEHSEKYNIIQEPLEKCYQGLYPEWDENHPIHIIGHSQGGLTARMLEYLLYNIINDEKSQLLSKSYKGYIKSITTISTPHNGTSLAPTINKTFPSFQKLSPFLGILNNVFFNYYYNFDLEQWGLYKNENETYYEYLKRINNSNIKTTKNSASWDLSFNGAEKFNFIYKSDSLTYYFSYSTSSSIQINNSIHHKPNKNMNYYLKPVSRLMSSIELPDSSWHQNDGIVNTISMNGPHDEKIIQYNGFPQTGVWQHMGILYLDHHQILLRGLEKNNTEKIINTYLNHCNILYKL